MEKMVLNLTWKLAIWLTNPFAPVNNIYKIIKKIFIQICVALNKLFLSYMQE